MLNLVNILFGSNSYFFSSIDSDSKDNIMEIAEACKQNPELCNTGKNSTSLPSIGTKQQGKVILYALFRNIKFYKNASSIVHSSYLLQFIKHVYIFPKTWPICY